MRQFDGQTSDEIRDGFSGDRLFTVPNYSFDSVTCVSPWLDELLYCVTHGALALVGEMSHLTDVSVVGDGGDVVEVTME